MHEIKKKGFCLTIKKLLQFKGNNYHQNFGRLSLVDEEFNFNVEKDIKNYIDRRPTNR